MNLFDLYAKIILDTGEYEQGLDEAGKTTSSFAKKLKTGLASAAKVGAAALGAASTGAAALAKSAVDSYADYEQLTGGVETLFKQSADTVMRYANEAYKTAGLSANQYMETVTSFSASLLQSLGGDTEAAARVADQAITDMSDNANKMGTDMSMIQNAYQGFARANYTMLDNLKLGYSGSKEEMERLLEDAEKLSGQEFDLSSYADIVEAIHVVQTEMGITGATAAEASETISGSVAAMKAAWENLKTGIADENQDIGGLVDTMVESVKTAAGNIIPAFQRAASGIGQLVTELIPEAARAVTEGTPMLAEAALTLITDLGGYIRENLPTLIENGLEAAAKFAEGLRENVGLMVDAALELMVSLAQGLAEALPAIIEYVPEIVSSIANTINDNAPKIIAAAVQIIAALVSGLIQSIPTLIQNIPAIIGAIVDTLLAFNWVNLGGSIIKGLGGGISGMLDFVKGIAKQVVEAIKGGISTLPTAMTKIGKNIVEGLWTGIKSMINWIKGKAGEFVGGIVGGIKETLGIHSPSRVFAGIGENMALGLGEGWDNEYSRIKQDIEGGMEFGTASVGQSRAGFGYAAQAGSDAAPITIVVQSVLDGRVIGETAYKYSRDRERAYGVS